MKDMRGGRKTKDRPIPKGVEKPSDSRSLPKKRPKRGSGPKKTCRQLGYGGQKETELPYAAATEGQKPRKHALETINVNGINVPGKPLMLGHFLHQQAMDICVTAEIHLTKQEADAPSLEGLQEFTPRSESCGEIAEGRPRGGVCAPRAGSWQRFKAAQGQEFAYRVQEVCDAVS